MRRAYAAAVAATLLVLLGSGAAAQTGSAPVERSEPAIILAPPPGESASDAPAESQVEPQAEPPGAEPLPPIARKKPEPPKKVSAPKPAQQKAPAKKAPAKKAPARKAPAKAAISPPQQAKNCDYCYGCESLSHACRRQWVCGARYSELLAAGLCRR
jgi:hypothetical protein